MKEETGKKEDIDQLTEEISGVIFGVWFLNWSSTRILDAG